MNISSKILGLGRRDLQNPIIKDSKQTCHISLLGQCSDVITIKC